MSAAHDLLLPERPKFATEWNKFDLLVELGGTFTIIEFKYYLVREKRSLDGVRIGYKWGAGPKNEAEFRARLNKLQTTTPKGIDDARVVLVHGHSSSRTSRYSFDASYGQLQSETGIVDVRGVRVGPLEGRVLRPQRGDRG